MQKLGEFIRAQRDKKDYSLREFARKIECSPAFLSDIELGRRNPSQDLIFKIAHFLEIEPSVLNELDSRFTEDIKKKAQDDPKLVFAFRSMLESGMTSDEVLRIVDQRKRKKKKSASKK